jgi:acyl carrier protein
VTSQHSLGQESVNTDIQSEVIAILHSVLGLPGGAIAQSSESKLLGAIPELDSMAVVGVLTTFEEQFGIIVNDDEIDGDTFETVGSLSAFVVSKLE